MDKIKPQIYTLLHGWLFFTSVLILTSTLPHWSNVTWRTYMSESLYFLLFLLSMGITWIDKQRRDLFMLLSLLFFLHAVSFVNCFFGEDCLWGDNRLAISFYIKKTVILAFFFDLFIMYASMRYILYKHARPILFIAVSATLCAVFLVIFRNFFPLENALQSYGENLYASLYGKIAVTYGLALAFILAFAWSLYRTDRDWGYNLNLLIMLFFIFLITEIIDAASEVYRFKIFGFGLIILTWIQIFCAVVLLKRYLFLQTDYGEFYEALVSGKVGLGNLPIRRHRVAANALLIRFIKLYLKSRVTHLLGLMLFTVAAATYFNLPRFLIINIIAISVCTMLIFVYFSGLFKKRSKRGFLMQR